jgi:hypothetical protein
LNIFAISAPGACGIREKQKQKNLANSLLSGEVAKAPSVKRGGWINPSHPPLMITNLNVIRNCHAIPGRFLEP